MFTIKLGDGTKALASSALMKSTFRALLSVGITILVFCERVTASQSTEHGVIPIPIQGVGISEVVYNDLAFYAKYCAVSYSSVCPRPMGNILVKRVRDKVTGTDGMIVRDDKRKEIVVAFRGTSELTDAITDILFILVPLRSTGLVGMGNAKVHLGFLDAYNAVALDVLHIVQDQLAVHPSYRIIVTGHSLGGAIAALGAISIKSAHPHVSIKLFTFGQPRVGNPSFADYVERLIGVDNIFRAVHTWDGVVTLPPNFLGYQHYASEYWNYVDPPSRLTIRRCQGREDTLCSSSIPSTGINPPHIIYFGQTMLPTNTVCT